jgi:hypothetical protein
MKSTLTSPVQMAEAALKAPDITGWVYVEFLRRRIGLDRISVALGRDAGETYRLDTFSPDELVKLDLLCRITAAFVEVAQPTFVLVNWLVGCCPWLDEVPPLELIASWQSVTEEARSELLEAARLFVISC